MRTIYLIDYENVGSEGLAHCDKLSDRDHVIIFFTKNAPKIDMTRIAGLKKHMLDMIEVPAGKQSADMHIASCIGYLISKYRLKNCHFVVISRDTDFDTLIKSWNKDGFAKKLDDVDLFHKKSRFKIYRTKKIKSDIKTMKSAQPAENNRKTVDLTEEQKTELYQKITEAVKIAGFDDSVSSEIAQLSVEMSSHEQPAAEIHNELQNKYKEYLEIYYAVKPILSAYCPKLEKPLNPMSEKKSEINSRVIQTLSKAGYKADVTSFTASTVTNSLDDQKRKRTIFHVLISRYGIKEGLEIYRSIKGLVS